MRFQPERHVENGPGGPVFVVATEQNHVMVLSATTGALVWDKGPTVFGQPAGDLGGANAVLFDMPGTAKPHLVAQGGKDKNLYLLDRDSLGGIGGELLKQTVATGEINGAPAVYTTSMGTYVAFHLKTGTGTTCPNGGRAT